ncbi:MAG: polysaccharide pyruvyl transferase family protein [Dehalococcoidia bacterium]|nr:polysaccharide pyruvyl transferase family protein [Dehalococcoidia bacterium]
MAAIFITNCQLAHNMSCVYNKGSSAHVLSTIMMLREHIPDAVFSTNIQMTESFADDCGVRVVRNKTFSSKSFSILTMVKSSSNVMRSMFWALLHKRIPLLAKVIIGDRELREYASADVIVDVSMDTFSDDFGMITVVEHSKDILIGAFLSRPVVMWAQSPGPFRSRSTRWLVRQALRRLALANVREEISVKHLTTLGVDSARIHVTADPAFALDPAPEIRAREILRAHGVSAGHHPLVGMTVSWTILMTEAKRSAYLRCLQSVFRTTRLLMPETWSDYLRKRAGRFRGLDMLSFVGVEGISQVVDHLVESIGAMVVLVPHDLDPVLDDRMICSQVLQSTRHPESVIMLDGDYSAAELKAVIGQCDLFVGAKMHANIAALSMGVPTLGIQYHHKFHGIMQLLGQEDYVCSKFAVEEVMAKFDILWRNKETAKTELAERKNAIKQRALENARLVAALIEREATVATQ